MKTLILVRHGKSSWEFNVSDLERPLKSRGFTDAHLVASEFLKSHDLPERIFSSPAKRALTTCKVFTKVFGLSEDMISISDRLYDFGGENVINFLKNLSNNINSVMIFGHNHAFTSISNIFGSKFMDNLPTSGLVKINLVIDDWWDLKQGKTEVVIIPKELKL